MHMISHHVANTTEKKPYLAELTAQYGSQKNRIKPYIMPRLGVTRIRMYACMYVCMYVCMYEIHAVARNQFNKLACKLRA